MKIIIILLLVLSVGKLADASTPGPVYVYPSNGQELGYNGCWMFKVDPVSNVTGNRYLWGFMQNGVGVWENYSKEGALSGTEYNICPKTTAYNSFQPGATEVWVRAYLPDNSWTDPSIITINLANPGPTYVYPTSGQELGYNGCWMFKVNPVANVTGNRYLWGFSQNGTGVWENYSGEGTLSGTDYNICPGTTAYSKFKPGLTDVSVRAYLPNNVWTDQSNITVNLANPGPTYVHPVNGQVLDYNGCWMFKVNPVANVTGNRYLWGFSQNGIGVWENYSKEGILSGTEYNICPGSTAYSKFQPGATDVSVRAYLPNNVWTDQSIVNVNLKATPTAQPLAWYRFEGDVKDSSGNGYYATNNGAVLTRDQVGRDNSAYYFDGSVPTSGIGPHVVIPDNNAFHFTDKFTLSAWVKPEKINSLHTIVNKYYALDSWMLLIENGSYKFVVVYPDGDWGRPVYVSAPASENIWTHVAGVYDGSQIALFINGVKVASQSTSGAIQDSTMPIYIGNHPEWNAFKGSIDDVRIYNISLTDSEIQTMFRKTNKVDGQDIPAAACATTDANLNIVLPCVEKNGIYYKYNLNRYMNLSDPAALYWKLENVSSGTPNFFCSGFDGLQNMDVSCIKMGESYYDMKLISYSPQEDPSSSYWKSDSLVPINSHIAKCDNQHLNLCVDETACANVNQYWYDNKCNGAPQPVCSSSKLNACITQNSCTSNSGYWDNGNCTSTPPLTTIIPKFTSVELKVGEIDITLLPNPILPSIPIGPCFYIGTQRTCENSCTVACGEYSFLGLCLWSVLTGCKEVCTDTPHAYFGRQIGRTFVTIKYPTLNAGILEKTFKNALDSAQRKALEELVQQVIKKEIIEPFIAGTATCAVAAGAAGATVGIITDGAGAMPTFLLWFNGCEKILTDWFVITMQSKWYEVVLSISKRFALETYSNMAVELSEKDISVSNLRADTVCRY